MIKGNTIPVIVSDEIIKKRERNWRKQLPVEFVEFIKEYNGLIPEKKININTDIVIERFLCLVDSISESEYAENDIDVIITKYDEYMVFSEDSIGADLIPFAKLNRDKLLCLCYEKDEPSVVIWSQDGSKEFIPNYSIYTDSFKEFLAKIEAI